MLRKRKLRGQQVVAREAARAEFPGDPGDEFANLGDLFKMNGAALAMRVDPRLKDEDLQKALRKE